MQYFSIILYQLKCCTSNFKTIQLCLQHHSPTKHLAALPTDMELNFTRSCHSDPTNFMCTHTLWRQRLIQLDEM